MKSIKPLSVIIALALFSLVKPIASKTYGQAPLPIRANERSQELEFNDYFFSLRSQFRPIGGSKLYISIVEVMYSEAYISIAAVWKYDAKLKSFVVADVAPEVVDNMLEYNISHDGILEVVDENGSLVYKMDCAALDKTADQIPQGINFDRKKLVRDAFNRGDLKVKLDLNVVDDKKIADMRNTLSKLMAGKVTQDFVFDEHKAKIIGPGGIEKDYDGILSKVAIFPDGNKLRFNCTWTFEKGKITHLINTVHSQNNGVPICMYFDKKRNKFAYFRVENLMKMQQPVYIFEEIGEQRKAYYIDLQNKVYIPYELKER